MSPSSRQIANDAHNDHAAAAPPPRANPLLLGHEDAVARLRDALSAGRFPHAWLITGPRGIGKATFAYRTARMLLSLPAGSPSAGRSRAQVGLLDETSEIGAGDDPVFRRVASGGHADLLTIERTAGKGEIGVDEVRRISGFLAHTPAEGGWRVLVVDAVDEMTRQAANALLKALEEPPDRTSLLLVAHEPGTLLATIRSRCVRVTLSPLADELVTDLLQRYRPEVANDAAALAKLSHGSIGRALTLAEHGGLAHYRRMLALLAALPRLDRLALHGYCDEVTRAGAIQAFDLAAQMLLEWLSRLIRRSAGADAFAGEDDVVVERLARAASLDRLLEVWEKVTTLLARATGSNLDRKQVLLNVFLNLEKAVRH
jgi:DNA polymerase-3 subunit delta'